MYRCPRCRVELPADARFCKNCGFNQTNARIASMQLPQGVQRQTLPTIPLPGVRQPPVPSRKIQPSYRQVVSPRPTMNRPASQQSFSGIPPFTQQPEPEHPLTAQNVPQSMPPAPARPPQADAAPQYNNTMKPPVPPMSVIPMAPRQDNRDNQDSKEDWLMHRPRVTPLPQTSSGWWQQGELQKQLRERPDQGPGHIPEQVVHTSTPPPTIQKSTTYNAPLEPLVWELGSLPDTPTSMPLSQESLAATSKAAQHWRKSWLDRQHAEVGPAVGVSRGQASVPEPLMAMQHSLVRMRAIMLQKNAKDGKGSS